MNVNRNLSAGFVALSLLVLAVPAVAGDVVIPNPLPDPGPETGVTDRPVKVYIMSGQSNMVGMGEINGSAPGTLKTITQAGMLPQATSHGQVCKSLQHRPYGVFGRDSLGSVDFLQTVDKNLGGPDRHLAR